MDQESKAQNNEKNSVEKSTSFHQNPSPFWVKNKRFHQIIIIPALVCLFFIMIAFQNCKKGTRSNLSLPTPNPTQPKQGGSPTIITHLGDKAIFKLEKPSNKAISHILWRIIPSYCRYKHRKVITSKASTLEMSWNDLLEQQAIASNFSIEAFIQLEDQEQCFIYRQNHVDSYYGGIACTADLRLSDTLSILSKLSSDSNDAMKQDNSEYRYFSVEDSVDLKFDQTDAFKPNPLGDFGEIGTSFNTFQWSIKKLFLEDPTELADQTNTSENLTHTFSQIGLYKVSVNASGTKTWPNGITDEVVTEDISETVSTELMIGRCDESVAVEIVLDHGSFGTSTPQAISDSEMWPIWNYVRPADTNANHTVQLNWIENQPIYKYKRASSTKFIEIDILKTDQCFFDTEPIRGVGPCLLGCRAEEDCSCDNYHYAIREDLSPLPSCSGKVYDMGTLDTNMTNCTDNVFVVAASTSIEGEETKRQSAFYKHCPANSEYCYFGKEAHRPDDQHCE